MQAMDDDGWETRVHGRGRTKEEVDKETPVADELRFGVLAEPVYLARGQNLWSPNNNTNNNNNKNPKEEPAPPAVAKEEAAPPAAAEPAPVASTAAAAAPGI